MARPLPTIAEYADRLKSETEDLLVRNALHSSLATNERDDKLSTWLLVIAGGISAAIVANFAEVGQFLSTMTGRFALGILFVSILAGLVQRYLAHVVSINIEGAGGRERARQTIEAEQRQRLLDAIKAEIEVEAGVLKARNVPDPLDQALASRKIIEDAAKIQSLRPDMTLVERRFQAALTESQPPFMRVLPRRKWQGPDDPLWALKWLTRIRAWQAIFVILQLLALALFMMVVLATVATV